MAAQGLPGSRVKRRNQTFDTQRRQTAADSLEFHDRFQARRVDCRPGAACWRLRLDRNTVRIHPVTSGQLSSRGALGHSSQSRQCLVHSPILYQGAGEQCEEPRRETGGLSMPMLRHGAAPESFRRRPAGAGRGHPRVRWHSMPSTHTEAASRRIIEAGSLWILLVRCTRGVDPPSASKGPLARHQGRIRKVVSAGSSHHNEHEPCTGTRQDSTRVRRLGNRPEPHGRCLGHDRDKAKMGLDSVVPSESCCPQCWVDRDLGTVGA